MFSEMQNHGRRIISEMYMEMVFEKCFLVTEMIEKYTGQRYTSEELVSRRTNTPGYAIEEHLTTVEKKTTHSNM